MEEVGVIVDEEEVEEEDGAVNVVEGDDADAELSKEESRVRLEPMLNCSDSYRRKYRWARLDVHSGNWRERRSHNFEYNCNKLPSGTSPQKYWTHAANSAACGRSTISTTICAGSAASHVSVARHSEMVLSKLGARAADRKLE